MGNIFLVTRSCSFFELETQANALSNPPISIAPLLVPYLSPKSDMKLKHGVIGLLKHVSQTASTRSILGEARVLQALRTCRVFVDTADISVVVQMSAINLTKHLCTHNGASTSIPPDITSEFISLYSTELYRMCDGQGR